MAQPSSIEIRPALPEEFFERDVISCARDLLGTVFRWDGCAGMVVETEAYSEHGDEACHTFFRPSAREFVEAHDPGTAYVYLNYGMYWLTNVLVKNPDTGERGFVLLRGLEPITGIATMQRRRNKERARDLCSGPGKLSMALGITGKDHGSRLTGQAKRGFFGAASSSSLEILSDRRIGISRSQELLWRFLASDNPHVSVPFGKVK